MTEPVTVAEVAQFLNLTLTTPDTEVLTRAIVTARGLVEDMIDRTFASYLVDAAYANTLPEPLRQATAQIAGAIFEDRDRFVIPPGVYSLVAPYRLWII